jgi:hypothetical protein
MCTVSWAHGADGYDLFFNRDELHTRAPELPPIARELAGVDTLGPRDGDHGGTWLLANEYGLTICLLNDYEPAWRRVPTPRVSRGHLVLACAAARSHADVIAALQAQPLSRTLPFCLMALSLHEGPLLLGWQGAQLTRRRDGDGIPLLTSSSYAPEVVLPARMGRFWSFVRSVEDVRAENLSAYHQQHDTSAGANSVLMRRSDACTRSTTHVRLDREGVWMRYVDVQWAQHGPMFGAPTVRTLPRRSAAVRAA